ncbi:P-loop containing nucleoside triphosphate hydrolase protein, partial [Crassisporium funariophilum]
LPKELLQAEYDRTIPQELAPSSLFWETYSQEQRTTGLRACLLLWVVTSGRIAPREFQLQATLSLFSGNDCLVDVGTGYGKTLCMILPCLLAPNTISMVVSPLKRLQALQVREFELYGIKTVAINEDTPIYLFDIRIMQDISQGAYSAILVQPEQLFMHQGHMPRLARMIATQRQFRQKIKILHVDEAHFIYSAGMPHYGLAAFRPSWARLGELRVKLRKDLTVQALSGTQPPHIKHSIKNGLLLNEAKLCSIKLSSNRPNIAYATHPVVGELSNFQNLDFLIPDPYSDAIYILPKTIVFHDSKDIATGASRYTSL